MHLKMYCVDSLIALWRVPQGDLPTLWSSRSIELSQTCLTTSFAGDMEYVNLIERQLLMR